MRFLLLAAAFAAAAAETPASFPEGYWERGWGFAPSGTSYQVAVKVRDLDAAAAKAQRAMTDGGARLLGAPADSAAARGAARLPLVLQYEAKAAAAERLAKKVLEFGDLQGYSVNRYGEDMALKEIDERLALVTREQADNEAALKRMPVSAYLLEAQRRRLTQAREACAEAAARATITVTLIPAGAPEGVRAATP